MSGSVDVDHRGGVAILSLNNPPVNGLSFSVRTALAAQLDAALTDEAIQALVVTGTGRMFCGGADIREFSQPTPPETPYLPSVINNIEASAKPVVAAIHGVAAGGGLEIALACHARLASPGTRVGLPEVTLGIVPGAGGTQRMPRLIDVEAALDLIANGKLIRAEKAKQFGFIDEIVESDLLETAITRARTLLGTALRRTSSLENSIIEAKGKPSIFDTFRTNLAKRARGFDAPYACVECIEAAVSLPFADGLTKEHQIFRKLIESDQSKAQRHAFFAEREVSKIPGIPKDTPTQDITTAAVVGFGTMGRSITMNLANAGIPVTVFDVSQEALDRGLKIVKKSYISSVSKGQLTQTDMDKRLALISLTLDYTNTKDVDVVIEAALEELALKKEIFSQLDAVCKTDTILATNTSTLDINEIASVTKRPEKVIGTHFFNPANVMRLMENVRGVKTSKHTIATIMKLSKTIGKIGVLVGVCDGFVGNRMLYAYRRQADFLLEEGAQPQQIDKVLYDFGMPMGPFQMADLTGLDIGWQIRKGQAATRPKHLRYSPVADRLCELGRFGQKTGAGWYRYEKGSRTPKQDPVVEALIRKVSDGLGITRRPVSDDEIIPRCFYPLINEGAKILQEGIALRASDIDVIWMCGYGFPRFRGGPMFWADLIGIDTIYNTMSRLYDEHGDWFEPAPLLAKLAKEDKGFGDL